MAEEIIRFNKTTLSRLMDRVGKKFKDSEVAGLQFRVGKKRAVFYFEKRIANSSRSALTMKIGAFPVVSIDQARRQAREWANLCERGIDPRSQRRQEVNEVTLRQAVEVFFREKQEIGFRTRKKYRDILKHQFAPKWFDQNVTEISAEDLVAQFHQARKTAKNRCWEMLKLYQNIFHTTSHHFKDSCGDKIWVINSVPEVRILLNSIVREEPKRTFVSKPDLGKLVVSLEQFSQVQPKIQESFPQSVCTESAQQMYRICLLCLFTGMRFIEAQFLKWEYLDLDRGLLFLPGRTSDPEKGFEGTKNRKDHEIPLPKYSWNQLQELASKRSSMNPFIFCISGNSHDPVARNNRAISTFSKKVLGFPFAPHACRRALATIAHDLEIPFLVIKRMLNHSLKGDVTAGYISPNFDPERLRGYFQSVEDEILKSRSEYLQHQNKDDSKLGQAIAKK